MNFISDLRQVGCFLRVLRFPPTNKTDGHDITEIVLKVALNTIKQTTNKLNLEKIKNSAPHYTVTVMSSTMKCVDCCLMLS